MDKLRHNITIENKQYNIPGNWESCTHKELCVIAEYWGMLALTSTDVDTDLVVERKLLVLRNILGMKRKAFNALDSEELANITFLLSWLHQSETSVDVKTLKLPKIKIGLTTYYGPTTGLKTTSFDEFIYADTKFVNISKKQDWRELYKLVAAFYRPKRKDWKEFKSSAEFNGDMRQEFNSTHVNELGDHFYKYMNLYDAMAILYFYWGFRVNYLLKYTTLFPKEKKSTAENKYGWAATRLEISGAKFGDYKSTGKANWNTIVFEMHRSEELRIKQEKMLELKKLRRHGNN